MKRAIQLLAALLVLQVLLALGIHYRDNDMAARAGTTPLLGAKSLADIDSIDSISIESADKQKIALHRLDGKWMLSADGEAATAADAEKVKQLVDKLKAIKLVAPIATNPNALDRFKVGDASFERRIILGKGGATVESLYFGRPLGTKQMHARRADQTEVFAASFTIFDAPINSGAWKPAAAPQ